MSEIIRPSKNDLSKNPYGIVTIDEKEESERWEYYPKNYDLIAHYIPHTYNANPRLFVEECGLDKDFVSRKMNDPERDALKLAESDEVLPMKGSSIIDPRRYKNILFEEQVCRFCGRKRPEVSFGNKAHAIWSKTIACSGMVTTKEESSFRRIRSL